MSRKHKHPKVKSMLGAIVDMSFKDFEEELKRQQVNIGTINNLILHLESVYADLRIRKDGIITLVAKGEYSKDDPQITSSLKGLYVEMIKVEQKITYLKQRQKELIHVGVENE